MITFSEKNNLTQNAKPAYKLWVKYRQEFLKPEQNPIRVYYSYDRPDDPEYGKRRLLSLVKERIKHIEIAILYDNITQTLINFLKHDQNTQ